MFENKTLPQFLRKYPKGTRASTSSEINFKTEKYYKCTFYHSPYCIGPCTSWDQPPERFVQLQGDAMLRFLTEMKRIHTVYVRTNTLYSFWGQI